MSSVEDLRRVADSETASRRADAENEANKTATAAQIVVLQQIIRALPPPLNAAATALGEGTFAALNISLLGVKNPSPDGSNNPVKLVALAIAFAIIKAIWCFIKSLLNPLPIVGSFFPLCSNDEQLQQGTREAAEAAEDSDNQTLNSQISRFNSAAAVNLSNNVNVQQPLTDTQPQQTTESETDTGEGITFDQFVAKTANAAGVTTTGLDITNELRSQTSQAANQGQTSANIPAQTVAQPEWQPSERSNEPITYQEYRKLFGL